MEKQSSITENFRTAQEAYYFLHNFHLRLRDTIDRFVAEFSDYTFSRSGPVYTQTPKFNRTNPHSKWILDLFPAYGYLMQFENQADGRRESLLEIKFKTDQSFDGKADQLPKPMITPSSLEICFWIKDKPCKEAVFWHGELENLPTSFSMEFSEPKHFSNIEISGIKLKIDIDRLGTETGIVEEATRIKKIIEQKLNYSF